MKNKLCMFLLAFLAGSCMVVGAQDAEVDDTKPTGAYAGVENCKMCHEEIHEAWAKSSHARSFDLLANVGQEKNAKCLPCHTTGYGQGGYVDEATTPNLKNTTCESCHGPGADHMGDAEKIVRTPSAANCGACHQSLNIHAMPSE